MKIRVLMVITGLGVGGAERQVVDLADSLVELGHEVSLVYLTGACLTRPKSSKINLIGFNMNKSVCGFLKSYFQLIKIIKEFKPDVVHSHMIHANILSRLARIFCKLNKLICTSHSLNEGGGIRMSIYKVTNILSDISTNVSEAAVASFVAAGYEKPGRMKIIYNGIDTNSFFPSLKSRTQIRKKYNVADDQKIIISIGRLAKDKDFHTLLSAFSMLENDKNNIKLWIVGDGELRYDLERFAEKLHINKNVRFMGFQNNIADWINAADLFVSSSVSEGFGLVVAEAMACEKLIISTDSGGVREVVGEQGILVPTQSKESLSIAINKALNFSNIDSILMGRKSRERILKMFSMKVIAKKWTSLYALGIK